MDCVACQAHLSMGFSRQEYWSGVAFPSPGDLPDPGIVSGSPALQADSLPAELLGKPLKSAREKKKKNRKNPFPQALLSSSSLSHP